MPELPPGPWQPLPPWRGDLTVRTGENPCVPVLVASTGDYVIRHRPWGIEFASADVLNAFLSLPALIAERDALKKERDAYEELCLSLAERYRPSEITPDHCWPTKVEARARTRKAAGLPAAFANAEKITTEGTDAEETEADPAGD